MPQLIKDIPRYFHFLAKFTSGLIRPLFFRIQKTISLGTKFRFANFHFAVTKQFGHLDICITCLPLNNFVHKSLSKIVCCTHQSTEASNERAFCISRSSHSISTRHCSYRNLASLWATKIAWNFLSH